MNRKELEKDIITKETEEKYGQDLTVIEEEFPIRMIFERDQMLVFYYQKDDCTIGRISIFWERELSKISFIDKGENTIFIQFTPVLGVQEPLQIVSKIFLRSDMLNIK
ncbi:hypothetical protein [Clostridium saccharoperbutylacetonicum]|uniref:hypothetical protein n=1 Tax=Clostridium saccharoperbutylacetonicum TaxID=36745 RepID=UPI0039ED2CAC